jgi:phage terminase large subunit GpA-like protein
MTSTPTIRGKSRIESEFENTDKRKWFCPCPDCGEYQELKWMQLKWEKKTFENHTVEHYPETAHYECEKCGSKWDDAKRVQAVKSGEWRPTSKFNGKRGYHLSGIACTFPPQSGYKSRLHQMAQEFLDAKRGGPETLKSWTNTFLAETFEDVGERMETTPLLERRENYTPDELPAQVALLVCAVDVQGDRVEYEVVGIGDDGETWGVEFKKIIGDPERAQLWTDLKQRLQRRYKRSDGIELSITCIAIDIRHKTKRVTEFIKTCGLPRVYGVYGASNVTKQVHLVAPHHNKHYHTWTYSVNTTQAKDMIFARMKIVEPGPRYMHWHEGYEKDYFDGLTAEEKKTRFSHGFPEAYYEKIRARNEPLDLRVYLLAALDILKPNIEAIRKSLEKPVEPAKQYDLKPAEAAPAPKAETKKPFAAQPKRGFVGGWRK